MSRLDEWRAELDQKTMEALYKDKHAENLLHGFQPREIVKRPVLDITSNDNSVLINRNDNVVDLKVDVQGVKGDKGDTGDTGPMGPKGDKGDIGTPGKDGAVGPKGDKGEQGEIGLTGPKGDDGARGPKGDAGKDGADGAVGPVGPKGADGAVGAVGPKGADGAAKTVLNSDATINVNETDASYGLSVNHDATMTVKQGYLSVNNDATMIVKHGYLGVALASAVDRDVGGLNAGNGLYIDTGGTTKIENNKLEVKTATYAGDNVSGLINNGAGLMLNVDTNKLTIDDSGKLTINETWLTSFVKALIGGTS